ncbi:MAG: hypothetical protein ACRD0P_32570, partial [Stackebrandtia sp.]
MTHVGSPGVSSYPAEKASLGELYTAVKLDRPDSVRQQAEQWSHLETSLNVLAAAVSIRMERISTSADGEASAAYLDSLREQRDQFRKSAAVASVNATAVGIVGEQMGRARQSITATFD